MMNCRQATRLISESQERPLTFRERLLLKMHTMMCSGCRNFGRHMEILRKISRNYAGNDSDIDPKEQQ